MGWIVRMGRVFKLLQLSLVCFYLWILCAEIVFFWFFFFFSFPYCAQIYIIGDF